MKIIGVLPKQPSWGLSLYRGEFQTGYTPNQIKNSKIHPVCVVELEVRPDFISRGRSSTVVHLSTSNDKEYETSPKFFSEIVSALLDGDFKQTSQGFIKGYFSFKKQGNQIYLYPYLDDINELNKI